jgi:4-amino-4-deoxy-L-arabinose transferase-like glycosyltransferase
VLSRCLTPILLISILRIWMASRVGLGDAEAYYWTWSRQLCWSYYDHGPLVAWLIRAGTAALGQSTLAVRLPFILLSALTMGLVGLMAARLAGSHDRAQAAGWSVLGMLAVPAFLVAGGAANPDVPLLALVAGFCWALLAAGGGGSGWWLALAGLLAGLAVCAKYFGGLLLVPLVLACWLHRRRWWALAGGLLAALAGALPVLIWNLSHGWASLSYHLVGRHSRPVGLSLQNLGKLLGGQLAYISPVVLAGLLAVLGGFWRRRGQDPALRTLLWVALPPLTVGAALILVVPGAEPHWTAAGYLPLIVGLGSQMPPWWRGSRRVRVLTLIALSFSGLVALGFHVHLLSDVGVRMMPASYVPRYDLSNELVGWSQVADRVSLRAARRPDLRVAGCHYTVCSQLAFASHGRFVVVCPSPRVDQFDFFAGGDGSRAGGDLLYVWDERFAFGASKLYRCGAVRTLERVQVRRAGRVVRRFELQLCQGFGGLRARRWPPG